MAESNMDREGAGMDEDFDAPTVEVTDEDGRTIACYVEHSIELEGQEYVFLLPVDSPVEIFAWQGEDEDEEEAIPVEDEAEIDQIFAIARAVLQEQNLELKRTAVTLTVAGELPDLPEEESDFEDEVDGEEHEEYQLLASFYDEEQEYAVYAPLNPFFILARVDEDGQPQLLSPEELQKLEPLLPMIEDQLFDEME